MNPTRKRVFKIAGVSFAAIAGVLWILRDQDMLRRAEIQREQMAPLEERAHQRRDSLGEPSSANPSLEYEAWTKQGWKPVESEGAPSKETQEFTEESAKAWESRDLQGLHVYLQSVSLGIEAVPALDALARDASHPKTRWLAVESLGRIPHLTSEDEAQAALIRLHRDTRAEPEVRRWVLGQIRADSESGFSYLRDLISQGFSQESKSEWSDAANRMVSFALSQGWSWEQTQSSLRPTGTSRLSEEISERVQEVWKNTKGRFPAFSDQKRNSK